MYKKVEFKNKLARNIKKFRLERGLSQKGLSDGICEQSQISNLERGETMPTAYIMYNICKKLDISMEMLVEESMSDYMYKLEEFKVYANLLIKNNEYGKLEEKLEFSSNIIMFKDFGNDGALVYTLYRLKVVYFKIRKNKQTKDDISYLKKQYKIILDSKINSPNLVKIDLVITMNRIFIELGKESEVEKLFKISDDFLVKSNKIFHAEFIVRNKMNKIICDVFKDNLESAKIQIEYLYNDFDFVSNPEIIIDFHGLQAFYYGKMPGEDNKILSKFHIEKAYEVSKLIKNKIKSNYYKSQVEKIV